MRRVFACAAVVAVLSGCASAEPSRGPAKTAGRIMVITLEPDDPLQSLLGEIYAGALSSEGRRVVVNYAAEAGVPLYERQGDLFITCAAHQLQTLAPEVAARLRTDIAADEELADESAQREAVYSAYMGTLGETLDGADPAAGAHCPAPATETLPNHIVAVYRVDMFNRKERLLLNQVTGALKDDELEEWVKDIESGVFPDTAAAEFLEQYGFDDGVLKIDTNDAS